YVPAYVTPSWPTGRGIVTAAGIGPGGEKYDSTDAKFGGSVRFRGFRGDTSVSSRRPVNIRYTLGPCWLLGCDSERMMAVLSVCRAKSGIWSQMRMPGTTVSIGCKWLRMPC